MSREKEEALKRALTVSGTANIQPEDLQKLVNLLTPRDTPLISRLGAPIQVRNPVHYWTDSALNGTLTHGIYTESGAPTSSTNTYNRRHNHVTQFGKIAEISGLVKQTALLANDLNGATDALDTETVMKVADHLRTLEYYLWNGENPGDDSQFDGIITQLTTNVVAGGGDALTELDVQNALNLAYANGGNPTSIYCRPVHAIRIANFSTNNKVQYTINPNEPANVIGGQTVFKYMSPFGGMIDIVPVRSDFMPSGTVVLLDESLVKIGSMLDNAALFQIDELSNSGNDVMKRLIKSYMTLVLKLESRHALISNVSEALS